MPNTTDMFVIYFAVVTLSSICITIGIAAERKRIRKLNELLQTRKELSVIYKNESGPARSIRTVALDFDKDPWV
jgi:enolase